MRLVPLLLAVFLTSCGLWVGSPKKPDDASPEQSPSLAETPAAAVTVVETAVRSAGGGLTGLSRGGTSLAIADGEKIPGCSKGNEPVSDDSDKNTTQDEHGEDVLSRGHPDYALGKLYCVIAANSGDEGSVLGAFDVPKVIACLAGDNVKFDGTETEFDVEIASTACFAGKDTSMFPPVIRVKATGHRPAEGAGPGWDSSLELAGFDGDTPFISAKMLLRSTATEVAIGFAGGGTATDAFSARLDVEDGTLRYEGKFLRIPESTFSEHTRLLVKGTVGADARFTAISALEGAISGVYNEEGTSRIKNASLHTVQGEATTGYRSYGYTCNDTCDGQDPAIMQVVAGSGQCDAGPPGATCQTNDGIQVTAPADLAFLMRPAEPGFEASSEWIGALSPLSFERVTLDQTQQ